MCLQGAGTPSEPVAEGLFTSIGVGDTLAWKARVSPTTASKHQPETRRRHIKYYLITSGSRHVPAPHLTARSRHRPKTPDCVHQLTPTPTVHRRQPTPYTPYTVLHRRQPTAYTPYTVGTPRPNDAVHRWDTVDHRRLTTSYTVGTPWTTDGQTWTSGSQTVGQTGTSGSHTVDRRLFPVVYDGCSPLCTDGCGHSVGQSVGHPDRTVWAKQGAGTVGYSLSWIYK